MDAMYELKLPSECVISVVFIERCMDILVNEYWYGWLAGLDKIEIANYKLLWKDWQIDISHIM